MEKDLNLELSNILKTKMESYGASVIMTRYGDYDLSFPNAMFRKKSDFDNRILLINSSKSDMYISIHLNYLNDSRYSGVQVFYDGTNKKIAQVFQQNINIELKNDKKIKEIPKDTYMYDKLQVPGVLIECGFLSNAIERQKLLDKEYQIQLTTAIANSVVTFFT